MPRPIINNTTLDNTVFTPISSGGQSVWLNEDHSVNEPKPLPYDAEKQAKIPRWTRYTTTYDDPKGGPALATVEANTLYSDFYFSDLPYLAEHQSCIVHFKTTKEHSFWLWPNGNKPPKKQSGLTGKNQPIGDVVKTPSAKLLLGDGNYQNLSGAFSGSETLEFWILVHKASSFIYTIDIQVQRDLQPANGVNVLLLRFFPTSGQYTHAMLCPTYEDAYGWASPLPTIEQTGMKQSIGVEIDAWNYRKSGELFGKAGEVISKIDYDNPNIVDLDGQSAFRYLDLDVQWQSSNSYPITYNCPLATPSIVTKLLPSDREVFILPDPSYIGMKIPDGYTFDAWEIGNTLVTEVPTYKAIDVKARLNVNY